MLLDRGQDVEGEDGHVQISPRGARGQEGQGSPNYLAEDFSLRVLGRLIIVYTLTHTHPHKSSLL